MTDGLHWIDGVIVAIYACGMVALGAYFSRRQKSTDEYFVGNRAMHPFLIGISLFATLFSTISYLATPGELINHGPAFLMSIVSIPICYFIVGYWMIPVYMQHRVTSAYELLEIRLGLGARLTGATMFIVLRLMWMSLLIYFASAAMMVMLGLEDKWLPAVTFVAGIIAVFYSSLGGLRAVVITDLFQFTLLFGGALLVIATVTYRLGGIGWIPTHWNEAWEKQPLYSFDPTVRVTVLRSILYGVLWWVCTVGGDQTAIQRFMATKDAGAARRSFLVNSIAGAAVTIVLAFVGFALLGYFQSDPELLPDNMTIAKNADQLFPHFISHHLPIGLSGLVVSGMFAAAMSSVDSGVNSITAVVMTDFVGRFSKEEKAKSTRIRNARIMALFIGLTVVLASSFMQHVPGNFLEQTKRTIGLLVTPIFTLFFLAMFVRFTTQTGAILGAVFAFVVAVIVAYWESLTGLSISFLLIFPTSLLVGIASGTLISLAKKRPTDDRADPRMKRVQ